MRSLLLISTVFFILASFFNGVKASVVNSDDTSKAISHSYYQLINAYQWLDPQLMANIYSEHGYYVSTGKNKKISSGKTELLALYQKYFNKIKKNNFKLDIEFRVLERLIDNNSATDVGYYLVSVIPPEGSNEPAKQHAGKYLMTFKRGDDNHWLIWSDANNRVDSQMYYNVPKLKGLYFSKPLSSEQSDNSQCLVNHE